MKKINIIIILFLIVLSSLVYAYSLTTFSDGTSIRNMTFDTAESKYFNLSIPYWAVISKAEIDLIGGRFVGLWEYDVAVGAGSHTLRNKTQFYAGQVFSPGHTGANYSFDIDFISFYLAPNGGATEVVVSVREWNGTDPIGIDLENSTIENISVYSNEWVNFSFTNKTYWLNPSKKYIALIKSMDNSSFSVDVRFDTGDVYPGGNFQFTEDYGVTWQSFGGDKFAFMIFGRGLFYPSNITIKTNNEITYQNLSNFTGTVTDIDLNTSSLQNCVNLVSSGNANCTLNFTSDTPGALEYSNLEIDYSVPLNITFKDEKSDTLITGETFSIFLETTGFAQLYTSTNPFKVNLSTAGTYDLKVSSTNYPSREYVIEVLETKNDLVLYLINSTLGSEITFNIVSVDGLAPLDNVRTIFTKVINGTSTVIAEEDSDFAGQVVVTLDPNTQYTINFSKTDYEDQTITLEPKNSEYLIQMVSTVGAYNQSVHEGIRYRFSPINTILNNNTPYNFTFTLNSTVWPVTNCTLRLKNGSILLNETSSFTSNSCGITIEQNTFGMTNITSEAIYELDNQFAFTVSQQYSIIYTYQGEFSLMSFLDDLTDFSMAGFDSFGRMMLAFIVIFIIMSMASVKVGFENKEVLLFMLWGLVGFFSFIGWFRLNLGTMPDLLGIRKYFIFYLVTLIVIGFIMDKVRK